MELRRTFEGVDRARAEGRLRAVVIDLPRQADVPNITRELRGGLRCTSNLGVPSARRRQCICGFAGPGFPDLESFGRYQVPDPPALRYVPLDVTPEESLFIWGKVTVEPTIMTTGDPWLPHPAGHLHIDEVKHLLHKDTGPACALTGKADELKGYGGTLLLVDEGKVRALADREVARIL